MASQIITCPTITVSSGAALTSPLAWDISDAAGFAVVSGGSTTVTVQVAFTASSDATFSDLLTPWRSYSTGNHTATVVTTSGVFTFEGAIGKQVRFLSTGTIAAGFSITGAKYVDV
jgi:hypothetical protein